MFTSQRKWEHLPQVLSCHCHCNVRSEWQCCCNLASKHGIVTQLYVHISSGASDATVIHSNCCLWLTRCDQCLHSGLTITHCSSVLSHWSIRAISEFHKSLSTQRPTPHHLRFDRSRYLHGLHILVIVVTVPTLQLVEWGECKQPASRCMKWQLILSRGGSGYPLGFHCLKLYPALKIHSADCSQLTHLQHQSLWSLCVYLYFMTR